MRRTRECRTLSTGVESGCASRIAAPLVTRTMKHRQYIDSSILCGSLAIFAVCRCTRERLANQGASRRPKMVGPA